MQIHNPFNGITITQGDLRYVNRIYDQSISGQKTFFDPIKVSTNAGEGVYFNIDGISGSYSLYGGKGPEIDILDGQLKDQNNVSKVDWLLNQLAGNWYVDGIDYTNDKSIVNLSGLKYVSGVIVSLINAASAGVSTLNGLSGVLNLLGTGSVSITTQGQNLIISGIASTGGGGGITGDYYLNSNPSGFLNPTTLYNSGVWLSQYALSVPALGQLRTVYWSNGYLVDASNNIVVNWFSKGLWGGWNLNGTGILNITSGDNRYYPRTSNPSDYLTPSKLNSSGISLNPKNLAGDWFTDTYPTSNGHIINLGFLKTASGQLYGQLTGYSNSNVSAVSGWVSGLFQNITDYVDIRGTGSITVFDNGNYIVISGSQVTGGGGATGDYYPNNNPSGFINGSQGSGLFYPLLSNPSDYLTSSVLSGSGISLSNKYLIGSWSTDTDPTTDPNLVNLKSLKSASGQLYTLVTGDSSSKTNAVSGWVSGLFQNITDYVNILGTGSVVVIHDSNSIIVSGIASTGGGGGITGDFYPNNNPSGFITNAQATGSFYPLTGNPSGFLNNIQGSGLFYPLTGNPSNFTTLHAVSGFFVTLSGDSTIFGSKKFKQGIEVSDPIVNDIMVITEEQIATVFDGRTGQGGTINFKDLFLDGYSGAKKISWGENYLTGGAWSVQDPSGNPNDIVNVKYLSNVSGVLRHDYTGISGYLNNLIAASSAGVISINSQTGAITLAANNDISLIQNGNTFTFSGLYGAITSGQSDSRYYPLGSNPSGYITSGQTGQFASVTNLTITGQTILNSLSGASGALQLQIDNITSLSWNLVTGNTQMVANNGYIVSGKIGTVVLTLPTTSALGQSIRIVGKEIGWNIAQNANQKVYFGVTESSLGVGGYLASTHKKDCIELITTDANKEFTVASSIGAIDIF